VSGSRFDDGEQFAGARNGQAPLIIEHATNILPGHAYRKHYVAGVISVPEKATGSIHCIETMVQGLCVFEIPWFDRPVVYIRVEKWLHNTFQYKVGTHCILLYIAFWRAIRPRY
jgi:hypothetical protein